MSDRTPPRAAAIGGLSPLFISTDVPRAIHFYVEGLGFELRSAQPEDEPFFAILGRGAAQLFLKDPRMGPDDAVEPAPNHTRHEWMPWDAFVFTAEPEMLRSELNERAVPTSAVEDRDDGLRGFEVRDPDGYVLFFGRPN